MQTPTRFPVDRHLAASSAPRSGRADLDAVARRWGAADRRPPAITLEARPASSGAVVLRWRDDRRGAAAYGVLRSAPGDHWRLVAVLAPDQSRYADVGLLPETLYEYAVCRFYGEPAAEAPGGRWSNLVTVLTP